LRRDGSQPRRCGHQPQRDGGRNQPQNRRRDTREARLEKEKPTLGDRKPEAAQQAVPVENAIVKPVDGWKTWHRGKKQAAGRHGEPRELTRGDCGSRRILAAACRKVSCHATVAQHRRHAFKKEQTQNQDGYQKKCVAAQGHITGKNQTRNNIGRGALRC
jgi:hypothetical protein